MLRSLTFSVRVSCVCVLLGINANAVALTTSHGSICRPTGTLDGEKDFLVANQSGVTNFSGTTLVVVCPIVRTDPGPGYGLTVQINIYPGAGSASCTLHSTNRHNRLGSVSSSVGASFSVRLALPAAQVPRNSSQVVTCELPPGGTLWDVQATNSEPTLLRPGRPPKSRPSSSK